MKISPARQYLAYTSVMPPLRHTYHRRRSGNTANLGVARVGVLQNVSRMGRRRKHLSQTNKLTLKVKELNDQENNVNKDEDLSTNKTQVSDKEESTFSIKAGTKAINKQNDRKVVADCSGEDQEESLPIKKMVLVNEEDKGLLYVVTTKSTTSFIHNTNRRTRVSTRAATMNTPCRMCKCSLNETGSEKTQLECGEFKETEPQETEGKEGGAMVPASKRAKSKRAGLKGDETKETGTRKVEPEGAGPQGDKPKRPEYKNVRPKKAGIKGDGEGETGAKQALLRGSRVKETGSEDMEPEDSEFKKVKSEVSKEPVLRRNEFNWVGPERTGALNIRPESPEPKLTRSEKSRAEQAGFERARLNKTDYKELKAQRFEPNWAEDDGAGTTEVDATKTEPKRTGSEISGYKEAEAVNLKEVEPNWTKPEEAIARRIETQHAGSEGRAKQAVPKVTGRKDPATTDHEKANSNPKECKDGNVFWFGKVESSNNNNNNNLSRGSAAPICTCKRKCIHTCVKGKWKTIQEKPPSSCVAHSQAFDIPLSTAVSFSKQYIQPGSNLDLICGESIALDHEKCLHPTNSVPLSSTVDERIYYTLDDHQVLEVDNSTNTPDTGTLVNQGESWTIKTSRETNSKTKLPTSSCPPDPVFFDLSSYIRSSSASSSYSSDISSQDKEGRRALRKLLINPDSYRVRESEVKEASSAIDLKELGDITTSKDVNTHTSEHLSHVGEVKITSQLVELKTSIATSGYSSNTSKDINLHSLKPPSSNDTEAVTSLVVDLKTSSAIPGHKADPYRNVSTHTSKCPLLNNEIKVATHVADIKTFNTGHNPDANTNSSKLPMQNGEKSVVFQVVDLKSSNATPGSSKHESVLANSTTNVKRHSKKVRVNRHRKKSRYVVDDSSDSDCSVPGSNKDHGNTTVFKSCVAPNAGPAQHDVIDHTKYNSSIGNKLNDPLSHFDTVMDKLASLEEMMKNTMSSVLTHNKICALKDERIKKLTARLNVLEQQLTQKDIKLLNIEKVSEDENLLAVVEKIALKLGIRLTLSDIEHVYREKTNGPEKCSTIVVRFVTRQMKDKFMQHKKVVFTNEELFGNLSHCKQEECFIMAQMSPTFQDLYEKTKIRASWAKFYKVWMSETVIFAQRKRLGEVVEIQSEQDLDKITRIRTPRENLATTDSPNEFNYFSSGSVSLDDFILGFSFCTVARPMASLVLTDSSQLKTKSFEKLPDQSMYPYAEPYDLQKHLFSSCQSVPKKPWDYCKYVARIIRIETIPVRHRSHNHTPYQTNDWPRVRRSCPRRSLNAHSMVTLDPSGRLRSIQICVAGLQLDQGATLHKP
uniref:Uncharacterized protein n=1 Tax=Timema douglasi TaxID=61478 RepID=A0A7R8VSA8_TIMDO|nr:unnamed protein product [Timema douglasi]